ncbi:uncharacterized protein LOC133807331 isoform X2 [Humulus lupulus]|uniref:uncharacterized protein LOC133807331 isoform X2 n=1 Tax=Humulus lupulus TaxID=3486 RepID=UPI002B409E55|nr:uncharacterized protein LOC133807331 isoform X2 [Humulus lupulus]
MANFKLISLIILFAATGLAMLVTLIYTAFFTPSGHKTVSQWLVTTWVDFYINFVVLSTWIVYKESTWCRSLLWIFFFGVFGNPVLSIYILMQLFKLSPQEAHEDPIYHVLLRDSHKDNAEPEKKHSLVTARVLFSALGCVMLGLLIYTLVTDGSPFRKELLDPLMVATLVDFYCLVIALSVWVAYKESCLICAVFWIVLLICFGSIATCAYVVVQLFQLTSQDPLYLVLIKHVDRKKPH